MLFENSYKIEIKKIKEYKGLIFLDFHHGSKIMIKITKICIQVQVIYRIFEYLTKYLTDNKLVTCNKTLLDWLHDTLKWVMNDEKSETNILQNQSKDIFIQLLYKNISLLNLEFSNILCNILISYLSCLMNKFRAIILFINKIFKSSMDVKQKKFQIPVWLSYFLCIFSKFFMTILINLKCYMFILYHFCN